MPCNCGKKHAVTPDTPAIIGTPNGAEAIEIEFTVNIAGIPAGKRAWVSGDYVQRALDKGYIVPV